MGSAQEIRRRFGDATLVTDLIFIFEPPLGNDASLFEPYAQAGFDFIQCHPAGDDHNVSQAVQRIARFRRDVWSRRDTCTLIATVDDIRTAKKAGKLAVGLQLEGFRCLERNLDMVDLYYALGVRLCHPIFNITSSLGGGCIDGDDVGLTKFGRSVIARMNEVGMMVDGAHAGTRSQRDMIEVSSAPVSLTHHGVKAIYDHPRNVGDDIIRVCAQSGGVIGITGAGYYLGGQPTPELLFRHIDHVVQLVGAAHVGLGLDWTADAARLGQVFASAPEIWGSLDKWQPLAFCPPSFLVPLVDLMDKAGYGDAAVRGVVGDNWMRLAEAIWK
jgi:membrane dipeptidase